MAVVACLVKQTRSASEETWLGMGRGGTELQLCLHLAGDSALG